MSASTSPEDVVGRALPPMGAAFMLRRVLQRKYLVFSRSWWILITGFLEPVFYLFSIGIGVGKLIHGFEFHGHEIDYVDFVAPAMVATSAMNGAVIEGTYNFYHHLKFDKLYEQWLSTPMTSDDVARGELTWSLLRGGIYSAAFLLIMLVMGTLHSWWALAAFPAALLIGMAFGGAAMALTTYMRSWQDFDYIQLATLPLFLFSATFFPLTAYPVALRWVVELTPLYRAVALIRELTTGIVTWESAFSVVYLLALGLAGLWVVRRRIAALLLT